MREKRGAALLRPPRVFVPELAEHRGRSEEIPLRKEERDHVRSRRLQDGDAVIALDGKGTRARAQLVRGGAAIALLSFEEAPGSPGLPVGEPARSVTVLLACAEPARIEWAIEKGTECGAAAFVLIACDRSQKAHVVALKARLPRLRKIAEEATKQCDRSIVPGVEGPESTEEFLGKIREAENTSLLVADPGGAPFPAPRSPFVFIAIGPEGGFSPREISSFEASSGVLVSLGPRILRLETAVVVALSRLVDPV